MAVTLEQRRNGARAVRRLVDQAAKSSDWTTAARRLGDALDIADALARDEQRRSARHNGGRDR
jgi:hypothetical protein